jgi:hypothetical protein
MEAQVLFIRKTTENCMFTRVIVPAQPLASSKYKHEAGITIHEEANSPTSCFKNNLTICRMSDSSFKIILQT